MSVPFLFFFNNIKTLTNSVVNIAVPVSQQKTVCNISLIHIKLTSFKKHHNLTSKILL